MYNTNTVLDANKKKSTRKFKKTNGHSSEELYSFDMVKRLLKSIGRTITISEDIMSKYDLIDDTGRLIEVKYRRAYGAEFKKYLKAGFFFEKTKYDYLKDFDSLYINLVSTIEADYFFVWNVGIKSNQIFNFEHMMLDKCTDFESDKVDKEVCLLPINANMFRYKDGNITRVTKEEILTDINNEL